MYGTNLAPSPVCAGLMYVSARQINLKLPDGPAPVQVCVGELCSDPVVEQFSTHTALIRVQEPVHAHMPIWVEVDLPEPYRLPYPCRISPWDFDGGSVEVLHEGRPVARAPKPHTSDLQPEPIGCLPFGSSRSRFPLHLAFRLEPGAYSIRLTVSRGPEVAFQSAWLDIEVEACPAAVRGEWLQSMSEKVKVASLGEQVGDIVPSLLASPDDQTIRILMPLYSTRLLRVRRCVNFGCFLLAYLQNSLAAFGEATRGATIPAET